MYVLLLMTYCGIVRDPWVLERRLEMIIIIILLPTLYVNAAIITFDYIIS